MTSDLKRRSVKTAVARDPAARFAYELATKPPTKDVASVKAASDLYAAGLRTGDRSDEPRVDARSDGE